MNKFPLWKNTLLILLVVIGTVFTLPVFFGEDPAIQIAPTNGAEIRPEMMQRVEQVLTDGKIAIKSIEQQNNEFLIRLSNIEQQLDAQQHIKQLLGEDYTVALNLASATPAWLEMFGAQPMKLGLDLRGGVHFLLDVDVDGVIARRIQSYGQVLAQDLRKTHIRYASLNLSSERKIRITFNDQKAKDDAYDYLRKNFRDLTFTKSEAKPDTQHEILAYLSDAEITQIQQYTLEQTMATLRNRVNELGVSEAVVQQQGTHRVSIDLPGIQNTAQAQQILGGTATLEFHLVDVSHDAQAAAETKQVPAGSTLYYDERKSPVLLKNDVILTGESITQAMALIGDDGRPAVSVRLGGGGERYFSKVTHENVSKPMAIVYVETKVENKMIDHKTVPVRRKVERIISIATIREALNTSFQVTGLKNQQESVNLALFLRAGSLPTAVNIIEEKTIGPSMGKDNIRTGVVSLIVGSALVITFMLFYYGVFGIIANIALVLNVIFIIAILSLLGAALTLPGLAGIVLTVGMAVDANVLIFERIREELRNKLPIQASIQAGYQRAFSTIVDSNVTTLIVAIILFSVGTGAVKGFAVTLTVGILASMLTSITYTRAIVNWLYGGRVVKHLPIGI